jgi:hypothetical protein
MNETPSPAALVGLVVGLSVLVFGIVGLIHAASTENVRRILEWVISADLLHDVVVAPAVCLVGFGLVRVAPNRWRGPLQSGAVASAVVLIVAYPLLQGFAHHRLPDNASVLPLDYTTSVLTVLGIVWTTVSIWIGTIWWRSRPPSPYTLREKT